MEASLDDAKQQRDKAQKANETLSAKLEDTQQKLSQSQVEAARHAPPKTDEESVLS
ncbi:hypothetical protein LRP52_49635 [Photobacterium sp. ZSDE20]|nr:hypothetical protein [Photobacterium sp. ZSDE20]